MSGDVQRFWGCRKLFSEKWCCRFSRTRGVVFKVHYVCDPALCGFNVRYIVKLSVMGIWDRFEVRLVGVLPGQVRGSMHLDLLKTCALSVVTCITLFIPVILARLGASTEVISYFIAASYLGVFANGACLWFMRVWGMRVVSLASWAVGRFALFFGVFVSSAVGIALVATAHSFLENWVELVNPRLFEQLYPVQHRGRILAFVHLVAGGVVVCVTPIAGWILDRSGHQILMVVAGVCGLGAVVFAARLMSRVAEGTMVVDKAVSLLGREVLGDRSFVLFLVSLVLFGFGSLMPAALYPSVLVGRLGLAYAEIGMLGVLRTGAWLCVFLFGGWLTDRFGGLRCLRVVFLVNALVILPYVWAWNGWMLVPSFVALGVVIAGVDMWVMYTIIELADRSLLPQYTALCMMVIGGRGLVAPLVGLAMLRSGVSQVQLLIICSILTVSAAVILSPAMIRNNGSR